MRVSRGRKKNMVVLDSSVGKVRRSERMFVSREEVRRRQAGRATVTLVAVLGALLAIAGVISVFTEVVRPEIENQLPGVSEDAAKFGDGDAMTLAVIKQTDSHDPDKIVLVRFEPSEERIYLAGLPTDTVIDGMTLLEHFDAGGITAMRAALVTLTDCEDIYTLQHGFVQTRKLINYFDGVTITLGYDINYQSPDGERNINTVAGTRLYTGWEIARLLGYPDWHGGEEEHLYMYTYVLQQFLEQNFKNMTEKKLESFFTHICTYSTNDISTASFHSATGGFIYLSGLPVGERTMIVEPKGQTDDNGNTVYSGDELLLWKAVFGDRDHGG